MTSRITLTSVIHYLRQDPNPEWLATIVLQPIFRIVREMING